MVKNRNTQGAAVLQFKKGAKVPDVSGDRYS